MSDEKRRLRDEVAELSEAVRELHEELARQKNHVCCPGTCLHWHYNPQPYVWWYPNYTAPVVTYCGDVQSGPTITQTNSAGVAGSSLTCNVDEISLGAINYS